MDLLGIWYGGMTSCPRSSTPSAHTSPMAPVLRHDSPPSQPAPRSWSSGVPAPASGAASSGAGHSFAAVRPPVAGALDAGASAPGAVVSGAAVSGAVVPGAAGAPRSGTPRARVRRGPARWESTRQAPTWWEADPAGSEAVDTDAVEPGGGTSRPGRHRPGGGRPRWAPAEPTRDPARDPAKARGSGLIGGRAGAGSLVTDGPCPVGVPPRRRDRRERAKRDPPSVRVSASGGRSRSGCCASVSMRA